MMYYLHLAIAYLREKLDSIFRKKLVQAIAEYGEKWEIKAINDFSSNICKTYPYIWTKFQVDTDTYCNREGKPDHRGIYTSKWLSPDTEENGNKRFTADEIIYKIDQQGYRLYDFNLMNKPLAGKVLCFGCSNTLGIGLPDHDTWPYLLNHLLGMLKYNCINYGQNGGSIDMITRLIYSYLENNPKPKAIVCYFPDIFRIEYFSDQYNQPLRLAAERINPCTYNNHESYRKFVTMEYAFFNFVKNFKFIETICKLHKVPFVWYTWSPTLLHFEGERLRNFLGYNGIYDLHTDKLFHIPELTRARDNMHFGNAHMRVLARKFYEQLQTSKDFN